MNLKRCPRCQGKIKKDYRSCPYCGCLIGDIMPGCRKNRYEISDCWQEYVEDRNCKNGFQRSLIRAKRFLKKHRQKYLLLLVGIITFVVVLGFIILLSGKTAKKTKEEDIRNKTYSIEEDSTKIKTSNDTQGNPFGRDTKTFNSVTVGYYYTEVKTDPIKGKFYFKIESVDTNEKPRKDDFILDLAISNDGGNKKTFLCTDRYVSASELDDTGSITLIFSLNKIEIKSGTIIYYRIRQNDKDDIPTIGEFTL